MTYAISDLHGCMDAYTAMLDQIHFSNEDFLFVLGDAIDRGPSSIPLLQDILSRANVLYVPGNHDYFLLRLGPCYGFTAQEGGARPTLMDRAVKTGWMLRGGRSTLAQFRSLPVSERRRMLKQLAQAPSWVETTVAGQPFLLTHKVFPHFLRKTEFAALTLLDYLKPNTKYETSPVPQHVLISGHRCTMELRSDGKPRIFERNGHVVIDCGICQGGALACYCLEDRTASYLHTSFVKK